jgi:basic membrane protein A
MTPSRRLTLLATAAALTAFTLPAWAQDKIKVAAIYTVPVEQQWVSRIDKALKAAAARGEIEYVFSENVSNADYERVMRGYAEKGNTLIVGESFAVEAAARKVAKDYPKVSFVMGSSGKPQEPNFAVFDNYIQEPAYLTGMVTFINSWFDPPKAKEAAFAMIDKGADVMYAERFGVSDAAKEKGKLAIGNVINTQDKYPDTVVASALWNMEPTIGVALKAVKEGKFKAEDLGKYSTMQFSGSELAPLGSFEKKVPADIVAKVMAKQKAILDGSFKVAVDDNQPKPTAK